jgi:ribose transport system substrate-binding protein
MIQHKKRWLVAAAGVILLITGILKCSGLMDSGKTVVYGSARVHRFGATYMTMNNPFYEIIDDEIRSMVESRGDILITRDPALDVEKQMAQIQEMIDRKVDGIFVNPVDWKEIGPALEDADSDGCAYAGDGRSILYTDYQGELSADQDYYPDHL